MSEGTVPVRSTSPSLPPPIRRVLGQLALRLRTAFLLKGLGTTALTLVLGIVVGMGADFIWVLPQTLRLGDLGRLACRRWPGLDPHDAAAAASSARTLRPGRGGRAGTSRAGRAAHRRGGAPGSGYPSSWLARPDRRAGRGSGPNVPGAPAGAAVSWSRALRRLTVGLLAVGLIAAPPSSPARSVRHARPAVPHALGRPRPRRPICRERRAGRSRPGHWLRPDRLGEVRPLLAIGITPDAAWLEWTDGRGCRPPANRHAGGARSDPSAPSDSSARRFALTLPRLVRSIAYRVIMRRRRQPVDTGSRRSSRPPSRRSRPRVEPPRLHQATGHARPRPGPDRGVRGQPGDARHHAQPARPLHRDRVAEAGGKRRREVVAATLADGGRNGSFSRVADASGPYTLAHARRARDRQPRGGSAPPDRPARMLRPRSPSADRAAERSQPGRIRSSWHSRRATTSRSPRSSSTTRSVAAARPGTSPRRAIPVKATAWARARRGAWPCCRLRPLRLEPGDR